MTNRARRGMRARGVAAMVTGALLVWSCGDGISDEDANKSTTPSTAAATTIARTTTPPSTAAVTTTTARTTTTPSTAAATTSTFPPIGVVTTVADDVAYASASAAQRLDVYVPETGAPHALVVFIHGGGWFTGDKRGEIAAAAVPLLVGEGYAVASVNYRLSGEAVFPAQLLDVKAAIRWLRANAAALGVDPQRFAAVGESAGAHLAALLGTSGGETAFDDPALGNPGESSAVQAVIDFYGPVDLLATPDQLDANPFCTQQGRQLGALDPAIEQLLGAPAAEAPELARAANPITYLSAGRQVPPFLIFHGDHDCVVPHQASVDLDAAIRTLAGPDRSTVVIVPGSGHYTEFDFEGQLPTLLAFLSRTLADTN